MALYIYLPIFLISFAGIFVIFWKNLSEVQELSDEELKKRLRSSRSVRHDVLEHYISPVKVRFYSVYLPAFWRGCEHAVTSVRKVTLKFEKKLDHLSADLRGRHVNVNIGERSQYWQTLNGAKNGDNTVSTEDESADFHKTESEHQKSLPMEVETEEKKKDEKDTPL